jgi:hypothetical protein
MKATVFSAFGCVSAQLSDWSGRLRRSLAKSQKSSRLIATSFQSMLQPRATRICAPAGPAPFFRQGIEPGSQRPCFLAILEPAVDLFLEGLGEASDFAFGGVIHKYCRLPIADWGITGTREHGTGSRTSACGSREPAGWKACATTEWHGGFHFLPLAGFYHNFNFYGRI